MNCYHHSVSVIVPIRTKLVLLLFEAYRIEGEQDA